MKTIVIIDQAGLADLRPTSISGAYDEARGREARELILREGVVWTSRRPPLEGDTAEPAFVADGLSFHHARGCGSLFASPVPSQKELDELSRSSEALRLRREHFLSLLSGDQRSALHQPLIRWLEEIIDEQSTKPNHIGFFGDDDTGVLDLVCQAVGARQCTVVDQCFGQPSHITPQAIAAEGVHDDTFDMILDLGSLERRSDPTDRIAQWMRTLRPGGLLALTTSSASSLEYRLLGPRAPSFVALDRLTVLSIPALETLLRQYSFEVLELSTPGRLDVEMLRLALEHGKDVRGVDFWRHALAHGSEHMVRDLQLWLQRNRLSSYARVVARKP